MPLLVLADDGAEPADEHVHHEREARAASPRPGSQSLSSAMAPSSSVKNAAEPMIGHWLEWGT